MKEVEKPAREVFLFFCIGEAFVTYWKYFIVSREECNVDQMYN